MVDHVTPEVRSKIMRAVNTTGTGPEVRLRRALAARGLRYRLHHKVLGTRVDIAFVARKTAVFVDGCFWHGCPKHHKVPKTNVEFWEQKVNGNVARDIRVDGTLSGSGWTVLRFWSCEVKADVDAVADIVEAAVGEV